MNFTRRRRGAKGQIVDGVDVGATCFCLGAASLLQPWSSLPSFKKLFVAESCQYTTMMVCKVLLQLVMLNYFSQLISTVSITFHLKHHNHNVLLLTCQEKEGISNEVVEEIKTDLIKKSVETSLNLSNIINEELAIDKLNQIIQTYDASSSGKTASTRIKTIANLIAANLNKYQSHLMNSKDGLSMIEQDLKVNIESFADDQDHDNIDDLDPPSFVYHRLDKLPKKPKLCKYFKQLATLDTSALFLSANAFENPLGFISQSESSDQISRYMSFFNDCSRKSDNPGFQSNIKKEVLSLTRMTEPWRKRASGSHLSKYIVRRYIASQSGVFLVYPGTVLERSYQPSQRDWFRRAVELSDSTIFTAPYLDVGGAGYIVTLSRTFRGQVSDGIQSSIQGVIGIDFTLGYFHKLLMASMEICNHNQITCFLMDDRGYLVAHPSLMEPAGRAPIEYTHVTHKEPLVANDLLNHKNFVQKRVCNSHADCTIQRYYKVSRRFDLFSPLIEIVF